MKKIISFLFAFVCMVALAGVYFWRVNLAPAETENEPPFAPPEMITLVQQSQADVSRIYVTTGDEVRIFLPGEPGMMGIEWYLADAPDFILDSGRVQDLLRPVFALFTRDLIHEDTVNLDLADFGLNPPRLILSAEHSEGTTTLRLGNVTPDRRGYFLMMDGDPAMYLIPRHTAERMKQTTEDLIDRSLPPFMADFATYIRIAQRNREVLEVGVRTEDLTEQHERLLSMDINPLYALSPESVLAQDIDQGRLDSHIFEDFTAAFRFTEIAALNPADLSPFGLDDPFIDFHFIASDFFDIQLLFGNTFPLDVDGVNVPHIYVKQVGRPHVFKSPLAPVEQLIDINVLQILSLRFIALVPIGDVDYIRVTHTDPTRNLELVINQDPEDDRIIFPTVNGQDVPEAPFRVLYRLLIGLAADVALEPFWPTGNAVFTVEYFKHDGTVTHIDFFDYNEHFMTFSVDGEISRALTNHRNIEIFFTAALGYAAGV